MKNKSKKIILTSIIAVILVIAIVAAKIFIITPLLSKGETSSENSVSNMQSLADESNAVDFNTSNGMLYVNNEVVVSVKTDATAEAIEALFKSVGATSDNAMADIGIYKLTFKSGKTYEELETALDTLKASPLVENAYFNVVSEVGSDATEKDEDDDFPYADRVVPDDKWNGASWDVDLPENENWGMEAIDAPGAWGYLDKINPVKIGLIDSQPQKEHEDLTVQNSTTLFIDENTGAVNKNTYIIPADEHGTHVSGIMDGNFNNGKGVSGVMGGKGQLYHTQNVLHSGNTLRIDFATSYTYLLSLKTLIDQDVRVINISQNTSRLIGFAASHGNENAIDYLTEQANLTEIGLSRIIAQREATGKPDFVICVAAGNSNATRYYRDESAIYGYSETPSTADYAKSAYSTPGEIGGSMALYNNFLNLMDLEEVKDRVIVVGAVGIDRSASSSDRTAYSYAYFSNIGDRIDIVAPGVEIYSSVPGSYKNLSGTSMASPHVAGVAGLIFGANPELTGPEVKNILIASSTGRYYHGEAFSGLLNANNSVVNALKTLETPVSHIINTGASSGLDLCFVVDTTGSMGDDIDNAKENMSDILTHLSEKTANYRVALVDYRDFYDRTGNSDDYASKTQLNFTGNKEEIITAINALDLGDGGDHEETVFSGLMEALKLDWRSDSKKAIIVMGDAPPLDPEPYTEYTYDGVLTALYNAEIGIDYAESDDRVLGDGEDSLINVYTIGTGSGSDAADFFEKIAEGTGGSYADVSDASGVSDAITESIDKIKMTEAVNAKVSFGKALANEKINLYSKDDEYLFTIETDENGSFQLNSMEVGQYTWTSNGIYNEGTLSVSSGSTKTGIKGDYSFSGLGKLLEENPLAVSLVAILYILLCIMIPIIIFVIVKKLKAKKQVAAGVNDASDTGYASPAEVATPSDTKLCPGCGTPVAEHLKFCTKCATRLIPEEATPLQSEAQAPVVPEAVAPEATPSAPAEAICLHCGAVNKPGAKFCSKCGKPQ